MMVMSCPNCGPTSVELTVGGFGEHCFACDSPITQPQVSMLDLIRLLDARDEIEQADTLEHAMAAYCAVRHLFGSDDPKANDFARQVIAAFGDWMDAHPSPVVPLVVLA